MTLKPLNIETDSHIDLEAFSYVRGLDWDKLKSFYYVAKLGNISLNGALLYRPSPPQTGGQSISPLFLPL